MHSLHEFPRNYQVKPKQKKKKLVSESYIQFHLYSILKNDKVTGRENRLVTARGGGREMDVAIKGKHRGSL